jgi:hypothetical protein
MTEGKLFISLICPLCGGELCGGDSARVYLCFPCKKAFVMDNFPESLPLLIYKPKVASDSEPFYVPFYKINGQFKFVTQDEKKTRAYINMNPLGILYYPAFPNLRSLYAEDLTIRYAHGLQDVELEEKKNKVRMVDGTRNPVKLETIGKLVWLAYIDKVADVTGVEAEFSLSEVSYCLIPFEKSADGLKELMLGIVLKGFTELLPNGQ